MTLPVESTLLAEFTYELRPVVRGYANRTLYINLDTNTIYEKSVTQQMKDLFTGGRGFGLKLLWDAVTPNSKWNSPENELVIANGPICGITAYPGSGKSTVVTLSPLTENVIASNVGGYFAPFLKFSGFDAIEIQGKAEKDVIIFIDGINHKVSISEINTDNVDSHLLSEYLTEIYAEDEKDKKNVAVVCSGAGAEYSMIGMLNFSFYDARRKKVRLKQAGRGGIGTVLRNKKIKAIVAKIPGVKGNLNNVVDLEAITLRGKRFNAEMRDLDDSQAEMRTKGTVHLTNIMNDYDLL